MKSLKVSLNLALVLLVAMVLASGCTNTITPNKVVTHQAAFSGNEANGGFLGFTVNGEGVLTERAVAKYNALIDMYGDKFIPPIYRNFGITAFTNTTSIITKEALSDFILMNQWNKNGKK